MKGSVLSRRLGLLSLKIPNVIGKMQCQSQSTTKMSLPPTFNGLQFQEIQIPVPWGCLAAKVQGPQDGSPLLALHGQLDNAGTFDRLVPLLPANVYLVCLDFAGHGRSSHYPAGMISDFTQLVYQVKVVVEHFRWEKVTIMGHSMGAMIALFFTSMFPERVEKLISLDITKSPTTSDEDYPGKMAKIFHHFHDVLAKMERRPPRTMTYKEARAKLVQKYGGSVDEHDADVLLVRGLVNRGDDQFEYSWDQRATVRPFVNTERQLQAVASAIRCPFLLIKPSQGLKGLEGEDVERKFHDIYRQSSADFRLVQLDGRHHVHLSKPELVAPHIYNFLCSPHSKM